MMNEGQVHEWELSDDIEGYSFFFRKEFYETDEKSLALNALPFLITVQMMSQWSFLMKLRAK